MKNKYLSTSKLCEMYDVTKEYFLRKKQDGTFSQNIHYIQKDRLIRWNFQEIENWFKGKIEPSKELDDILSKVIPN